MIVHTRGEGVKNPKKLLRWFMDDPEILTIFCDIHYEVSQRWMEHALNLVVHYNIFREKLVTKKIMTILIMFFFDMILQVISIRGVSSTIATIATAIPEFGLIIVRYCTCNTWNFGTNCVKNLKLTVQLWAVVHKSS